VSRPTALVLIALALGTLGIYRALLLPALLIAPSPPLLAVLFAVEAALGIAGAIGAWQDAPWAPFVVVLLGGSIAIGAAIEVVLGILPYLVAIMEGVVALVVALLVAAYLRQAGEIRIASRRR
jgi:hypothetical protein